MVWIAAILFTAVGAGLFVKRRETARVQSFFWGARTSVGCVVTQAVFFVAVAIGFVIAYAVGIID